MPEKNDRADMAPDPDTTPDDDAEFTAQLPRDDWGEPRRVSRIVVRRPATIMELFAWLMAPGNTWIWRGQARFRWRLQPRLARDFAALPPLAADLSRDYAGLENGLIGFFKGRARRSLVPAPDDLDLLSWLAVMQHYGAPTRLLDWTRSPFVALWFAYEGASGDEDAALWGLNAYYCRREARGPSLGVRAWDHIGIMDQSTTDVDGKTVTRTPALEVRQRDKENDSLRWAIRVGSRWPLPVIPFDADARMTAQHTVLTCVGDLTRSVDQTLLRFEEWQKEERDKRPPGALASTDQTLNPLSEPAQVLLKIALPATWRVPVLKTLASMGVDAATLFPGLDGIGRQTSLSLDAGLGSLRDVLTDWLT